MLVLAAVAVAAAPTGAATGALSSLGTRLTPADSTGTPAFGASVALSGDGTTAVVGGPDEPGLGAAGAAWFFTRSASGWAQQGAKVQPGDAQTFDDAGQGVAISADGTTAVIGGGAGHGGAWIFTRNGATWTQAGGRLQPSDDPAVATFGNSAAVSADGTTVLIGAPQSDGMTGAAWVFTRGAGGTWSQQGSRLVPSGPPGPSGFGTSVALSADGNTALIGSGAGAWIFTRSGAAWMQAGPPLAPTDSAGAASFGSAVALSADGNTALVGGASDGAGAGAAWVFTRSSGSWLQQGPKLTAGESGALAFGTSVSLTADGNTALVGAARNLSLLPGPSGPGGAYVFVRSGTTWARDGGRIAGPDATTGAAVAIAGNGSAALLGDPQDGLVAGSGNTHGSVWSVVASAPPPAPGGSGGGGGGGGGAPNLEATVSVTPAPHAVGDQYAYAITLTNAGQTSGSTTLTVNLPAQTAYNGSVIDRGPGCSASGQTVTCPLDFFPAGLQTTVLVGARVTAAGPLVMTASTASSPADANPGDSAATVTLEIVGLIPPVSFTPTPLSPPVAVFAITRPKPVVLHRKPRVLTVAVRASAPAKLALTLLDGRGHRLTGWARRAHAGTNTLSLPLPASTRPGHDTLRIAGTGAAVVKTVAITIAR